MVDEERTESEARFYQATAARVRKAFLAAGWAEHELMDLERWFRGEWLSLRHPDTEEL